MFNKLILLIVGILLVFLAFKLMIATLIWAMYKILFGLALILFIYIAFKTIK